jgi:3-phenylpropionate/cinnamic acid dioxygenase small subunit
MPSAASPQAETILSTPATSRQVRYGEDVYNEVMHFLIEEAYLLDEGRFAEWLELLEPDVWVTMPTRQSTHRAAGRGFSASMVYLREDHGSLAFKVKRLQGENAFNEDPPSRTRRRVSNLRLFETGKAGEYLAQSVLLLRRARGDAHVAEEFSARRDDVLRRTAAGWKLASRIILMDQAVLGLPNLALFL